jgi:acyl-CoA hydrolase
MSSQFTKSLEMSVLMTPEMANFYGNVHGGQLLKMLDEVAYACASRYCGQYCVTLSVNQVFFKHPIKIGSLVTFLASVNFTGKTSMEIGVKVISEDIHTRSVTHTNSCYFTMVAIDDNKRPVKVPQLQPETELEKQRFKKGKKRREHRLEMNKD